MAVASKNLTVRFIADTSKSWDKQVMRVKRDLMDIKKAASGISIGGRGRGGMPGVPGAPKAPGKPGGGSPFGDLFDKSGETASLLKGDLSGALTSVAGKLGFVAAGAIAVYSGFSKIISTGAETRNYISQFKTILGQGEEAAVGFFNTLKKFGADTPLELPQIATGAKQLLAVKVAAKDIIPSLKMLGDISLISGKNFNDLTNIFAKNKASNFIQGEDLNQLIEAGIPVLDEFGKMFGKTAIQVKEMGSKNQITFEHLQQAFKNMTAEGGIYFNGMKSAAQEVPGIWSNIMDTWNDIFRAISGADLSSKTISFWYYLRTTLADFSERFSAFVEMIRPALVDFGTAIGAIFRSVWDVFIAIWDVLKPMILPALYTAIGIVRALLWVVTKSSQMISGIAKAISWVAKEVYSILDSMFGITEKIRSVVQWIETAYQKLVTIAILVGEFIKGVFDDLFGGGLAKLGDRIFDALVGGFTRAWDYIKNTELYKLISGTVSKGVEKVSGFARETVAPAISQAVDTVRGTVTGTGAPNSQGTVNNTKATNTTVNNNINVRLTPRENQSVFDIFNQSGRPLAVNP